MKIIAISNKLNNTQKEPIISLKPDTAIVRNNEPFFYPDFSKEIHSEVKLVLKINRVGKNISTKFAHRYYNEIGIGIDFIAKDLQEEAIEKGLPWDISKAFDRSAPIGKFIEKTKFNDLNNINFSLNNNSNTVQKVNTKNMIFSFDELISYISKFFTLKTGDLIFAGIPVNSQPVKIGDRLQAYIEDDVLLDFYVK